MCTDRADQQSSLTLAAGSKLGWMLANRLFHAQLSHCRRTRMKVVPFVELEYHCPCGSCSDAILPVPLDPELQYEALRIDRQTISVASPSFRRVMLLVFVQVSTRKMHFVVLGRLEPSYSVKNCSDMFLANLRAVNTVSGLLESVFLH